MDTAAIFHSVATAATPNAKWLAFTQGLAGLGLDQINYAFLDFATYGRMEARGDPAMSTMSREWIEHYTEQAYDIDDDIVAHVRAGRFDPRLYRTSRTQHFTNPTMAHEAKDAGLNVGLLVPLPGPWGDALPAAGIVMGSSLRESEGERLTIAHAGTLIGLAHVLHHGMTGELLRLRAGAAPLSPRERDCLQFTAQGLRVAQIADRLHLADVTVNLYLKNARQKLSARSLPEAVAKAMLFQQIEIG